MTRAFFPEPFDLPYIATVLLDDKFFMAAYVLCGHKDRWYACVDQLAVLIVEFTNAGIPEDKLFRLAALLWQWSKRLRTDEIQPARNHFGRQLNFILGERLDSQVKQLMRQRHDDGWEWRRA